MSSLSLNASIRTCSVETGEASRIESDRFLNPNNMVCIPWNGYNNKGQKVCADSWNTKTAGCRSAMDRVSVENHLRPDYAAYVNLNTAGIQGDIYGNATAWDESGSANAWQESRNHITGNYGNQWGSTNYQTCGLNAYENAMSQTQQNNRGAAFANNAFQQNQYKQAAGGSCGY
jgi:hypothetical protein